LLWKPEFLVHPNGATSLEAITIAVADPTEFTTRLAPLVGTGADRQGELTLKLAAGAVRIVGPAWLDDNVPRAALAPPCVAAMALGVADLGGTAATLSANGIAVRQRGGSIIVQPQDACGVLIEFVER
jgi:hypothetical protein